jgi:hypothetical protein
LHVYKNPTNVDEIILQTVAKKKQIKPAAPGLDIPINEYHADTSRISKSGLDEIHKSPAHYHYRYLDPSRKPETVKEWSVTGNIVGQAFLEPDIFASKYIQLDDSEVCIEIAGNDWQAKNKRPRSTKKYEEWMELRIKEYEGKTILTPEQYTEVIAMRDALRRHRAIKALVANGHAERTFYHKDQETGADCRTRPDWLNDYMGYVFDCKTAIDASPAGFGRAAGRFRYHVQDAFYTDGLIENGFTPKGFVLGVVEKEPPYNAAAYIVPPEVVALGRHEYKADLRIYAEAKAAGKWPGYDDEAVMTLQFPEWMFRRPSLLL